CVRTVVFQTLLTFLSFYSSGDHRDLHSFPTRRSSDLEHKDEREDRLSLRGSFVVPPDSINPPAEGVTVTLVDGDGQIAEIRIPRSEEHTSELQSLAYLVCRLLLEKKKKYSNNAMTRRA